jgi:hypothetical protein
MYRLAIFIVLLTPLVATGQSAAGAPVIRFSFYALPQNDSPVNIVGFQHSESEINFVFSNASNKTVASVLIDRVEVPPPGCAGGPKEEDSGTRILSGGRFLVHIPAHARAVLSGAQVHYPKTAVKGAQDLGAAYLQVQVGVTAVYFEDGSTWPDPIDLHYRNEFDSKLIEAEAGKCSDVSTVANALQSVKEIVFDREIPQAPDSEDEKIAPPHLRFSCSLEGPKAVCRMPLHKDPS